jgi:ubiquinone/menaquinone biosynthesis C-methylase UbiE
VTLDHWAAYYRGGALVSCPVNAGLNYDQEVRDAWVAFFSALPVGARILDIGTGNGAVALIARETAAERSLELRIKAVDLAEIDPPKYVPDGAKLLAGIEFSGGVSTEALPFDESSFDAISGQYIVEYTDIPATLRECARVLVPGGACQLILHHEDSIVVANARESLRHAVRVRDETRLVSHFRRYCELIGESADKAEPARQDFIAAGRELEEEAAASSNPLLLNFVLDSITRLLENRPGLGQAGLLEQVNRLEQLIDEWVSRLDDLVSAALDADGMQTLADDAEAAGFDAVQYEPQTQGGETLVGWRLHMRRAALP